MTIAASEKSFLGQPRGLTVLFLTEMWEKFSFFGMRTLLVYYMTTTLLIEQGRASIIYGVYTAVIYLTPIFGGVLADRWLGRRRSVVMGASIMILGHFMMASEALFYPALADPTTSRRSLAIVASFSTSAVARGSHTSSTAPCTMRA